MATSARRRRSSGRSRVKPLADRPLAPLRSASRAGMLALGGGLGMPCADGLQRLIQIGDQVAHILDANREAQQGVRDTAPLTLRLRNRAMRHRGGMAAERLDAAEALGELEDTQMAHEDIHVRARALKGE